MNDALIVERILDLAVQIQQIPGMTFGEGRRAEFIRSCFNDYGSKNTSMDDLSNVFTKIAGRGEKPPLVISAHLDTVFPIETELTCTRTTKSIFGPGIGDNSLGLACLFGLYWYFTNAKDMSSNPVDPEGDIWLVANVGEEGLGDLRGMKAIADRFRGDVVAYLVLEGMSLGHVYTRGLGVRRYRIRVHTKGGHSWMDYGSPSAIHEIADLVMKIRNIAVPNEPRSSLNVGVINGGTSVNTIAADASLELDLRSESVEVLKLLSQQVESLVSEADRSGGDQIQVHAEMIGDRPAGEIPEDHPLVRTVRDCFIREGVKLDLKIGSTDANVPLSRGYPALCFGLTTGGGSHTLGEYINIEPVRRGFRILVDLVPSIFRMQQISS